MSARCVVWLVNHGLYASASLVTVWYLPREEAVLRTYYIYIWFEWNQ